jgi:excisionase family DNA binding protein
MTASLPARQHVATQFIAGQEVIDAEIVTHDRLISHSYELLLTPDDVASILQIGRTRVYELLNSEDLRSFKIGKSRRIRRADLDDFIVNLMRHQGR